MPYFTGVHGRVYLPVAVGSFGLLLGRCLFDVGQNDAEEVVQGKERP